MANIQSYVFIHNSSLTQTFPVVIELISPKVMLRMKENALSLQWEHILIQQKQT